MYKAHRSKKRSKSKSKRRSKSRCKRRDAYRSTHGPPAPAPTPSLNIFLGPTELQITNPPAIGITRAVALQKIKDFLAGHAGAYVDLAGHIDGSQYLDGPDAQIVILSVHEAPYPDPAPGAKLKPGHDYEIILKAMKPGSASPPVVAQGVGIGGRFMITVRIPY